jgi:hypothetical protein
LERKVKGYMVIYQWKEDERYSHQNGAHIEMAMDKLEARYQTTLFLD